jgi:outer membrane protein assembly factor BamD
MMTASRLRRNLILVLLVASVGVVPGCAKRKAQKAEERAFASAEELYRRGIEKLARDNLAKAREDLERITFSAETMGLLEPLVKLRLAATTFYRGDDLSYIDARAKYLDFVVLHADHPLAPYAQFQAGICSLKQVSAPTQDQTQTHTSLEEFREVIRRWTGTAYAQAAEGVVVEAETYLARHEYSVGRFYFKKRKFKAAANRFRGILDRYPSWENKDRVYRYLGESLLRSGSELEGTSYLNRVIEDYPDSNSASEARKVLAKADDFRKKLEKQIERENKKKNKRRKKAAGKGEPTTAPEAGQEPEGDAGTGPGTGLEPDQNSLD